jgi:hypothetical protein
MNYDLALIAAVLETKDFNDAIKTGASADILEGDAQIHWDVLSAHYEQFHEVPSLAHFKTLSPSYEHEMPTDSIEAIVHELKTMKLGNDIDRAIHRLAEVNSADPWEAKKAFVDSADRINVRNQRGNTDHVVGADKEKVMELLRRIRSGEGLLGHRWPWDYFNQETPGIVPGNIIYMYGRQKSRKTFILLYMALYFASQGLRVLFFTREMSADELKLRAYALACQFNFGEFLKGQISTEATEILGEVMDELAASNRFIITDQADGIAGYKAKVEEIKPHIVIHDYFKALADDMMGDNSRNEHRYVARTVDLLCDYHTKSAKVPLIMCGHANREGAKTNGKSSTEHAWSDHITRRVDMAIRVMCSEEENKIALVINEGRNIRKHMSITVDGSLCDGFGTQLETHTDWLDGMEDMKEQEQASKKRNNKGEQAKFSVKDFSKKRFRSR